MQRYHLRANVGYIESTTGGRYEPHELIPPFALSIEGFKYASCPVDLSNIQAEEVKYLSCYGLDLTCERLPKKYKSLRFVDCLIRGDYSNTKLSTIDMRFINFRMVPHTKGWHECFERVDVVRDNTISDLQMIPKNVKFVYNSYPISIPDAMKFLDKHPLCEALRIELNGEEEDLEMAMEMYQRYTQLSWIQGAYDMIFTSIPAAASIGVRFSSFVASIPRPTPDMKAWIGVYATSSPLPRDIVRHRINPYLQPKPMTQQEVYNVGAMNWVKRYYGVSL